MGRLLRVHTRAINRPGARRPCDPSASTRAVGQSPCCGASGCDHSTRRCLGATCRLAGRGSGGKHLQARAGHRYDCSAAAGACYSAGSGGGGSRAAAAAVRSLGDHGDRGARGREGQMIPSCSAAACCRAMSGSERTGPCCEDPYGGHECHADRECRAGRPAWSPPSWDPSASDQLA